MTLKGGGGGQQVGNKVGDVMKVRNKMHRNPTDKPATGQTVIVLMLNPILGAATV
jgi:hypothetical protein